MDNDRRREIYLRDRTEPTNAQRRRLTRHQTLADQQVRPRISRQRKAVELRAFKKARTDGTNLVAAIRGGWFSPRRQRELRATQTLEALKAATHVSTDDTTVAPE